MRVEKCAFIIISLSFASLPSHSSPFSHHPHTTTLLILYINPLHITPHPQNPHTPKPLTLKSPSPPKPSPPTHRLADEVVLPLLGCLPLGTLLVLEAVRQLHYPLNACFIHRDPLLWFGWVHNLVDL